MKKIRVLVLMHEDCVPPEGVKEPPVDRIPPWKTEFDVTRILGELGHDVRPLAVASDLKPIRTAIEGWKPDVVFVLLEIFHGEEAYLPYVVGSEGAGTVAAQAPVRGDSFQDVVG